MVVEFVNNVIKGSTPDDHGNASQGTFEQGSDALNVTVSRLERAGTEQPERMERESNWDYVGSQTPSTSSDGNGCHNKGVGT